MALAPGLSRIAIGRAPENDVTVSLVLHRTGDDTLTVKLRRRLAGALPIIGDRAPAATRTGAPGEATGRGAHGIERPCSGRPPQLQQMQQAVEVVFSRSGRVVRGIAGETVLELAIGAGINIDSSCRAGGCGVCRITMIEGTVDMTGQSILGDDEIEAGQILACSARVRGRVVVDA